MGYKIGIGVKRKVRYGAKRGIFYRQDLLRNKDVTDEVNALKRVVEKQKPSSFEINCIIGLAWAKVHEVNNQDSIELWQTLEDKKIKEIVKKKGYLKDTLLQSYKKIKKLKEDAEILESKNNNYTIDCIADGICYYDTGESPSVYYKKIEETIEKIIKDL